MGPVFFNIFINDIFEFIKKGNLYNYADDNTLSYADDNVTNLVDTLEHESKILIKWFKDNQMQANPDKFQAIAIGNKTKKEDIKFHFEGVTVNCDDEVKLLGVTFDFKLDFRIVFKCS